MANVLILSAGRRVSLVRHFQTAAHAKGLGVLAADMAPGMSSACQVADRHFLLPHVRDAGYADALRQLCSEQQVVLVVPTLDTELLILSRLRADFLAAGVTIVVSDEALITVCRDKRLTAAHFAQKGLESPALQRTDALTYPVIVKPFDGSLSAGVQVLRSAAELTAPILAEPRNIFCTYLEPTDFAEYTCDAYFDATTTLRCVVPRLRVEVRGGEVSKGRAERNNIPETLFRLLGKLPGARGCLTIQIMRHRINGALYLIEVNPRFGGGYPLTAQAGAAYHNWLIREYVLGETITDYQGWQDGLTMLRYDAEIYVSH